MSTLTFGPLTPLKPEAVRYLVVHHAGPDNGADQSAKQLHDYHLSKGWSGLGYHYVIRKDGTVEEGRPVTAQGAHVEGLNSQSLGICCTGRGDLAPFTEAQMRSLGTLLKHLMSAYKVPIERVIGHREAYALPGVKNTGKSCPGKLVSMEAIRTIAYTGNDPVRTPSPEPTAPTLPTVTPHVVGGATPPRPALRLEPIAVPTPEHLEEAARLLGLSEDMVCKTGAVFLEILRRMAPEGVTQQLIDMLDGYRKTRCAA